MKVILKIKNPGKKTFTLTAKDYDEAKTKLKARPYAACYEALARMRHKYDGDDQIYQLIISAAPTIAMPDWSGAKKLKGDEKKHWDAMVKALAAHEAEHHKKFVSDAKSFKKKREADGDFPKDEYATVRDGFFDDCQATQVKFDKDTNHGKKTGVYLP